MTGTPSQDEDTFGKLAVIGIKSIRTKPGKRILWKGGSSIEVNQAIQCDMQTCERSKKGQLLPGLLFRGR